MRWAHYVYLFGMKEDEKILPYTKVGVSASIPARMDAISTGTPFDVFCEGFIGFNDRKEAHATERHIHNKLKIVQAAREWFIGPPSDIYHAIVPDLIPESRFEYWDNGRAIRPEKKYRFRFAVP